MSKEIGRKATATANMAYFSTDYSQREKDRRKEEERQSERDIEDTNSKNPFFSVSDLSKVYIRYEVKQQQLQHT